MVSLKGSKLTLLIANVGEVKQSLFVVVVIVFLLGWGGSLLASELKHSSQIPNLIFINRDLITAA